MHKITKFDKFTICPVCNKLGNWEGTGFCSEICYDEFNDGDSACWLCGRTKSEEIWNKYKQNYCSEECRLTDKEA